jgi:hypothetical protein
MGSREDSKGFGESFEKGGQFGTETRADLFHRGLDRVVEDGSFQDLEEVFAERECKNLVRREGGVPDLERVEKPVIDVPVTPLAGNGKARVHECIEIPVDRSSNASEFFREFGESNPSATSSEVLDQLPLTCELISAHGLPSGRFVV